MPDPAIIEPASDPMNILENIASIPIFDPVEDDEALSPLPLPHPYPFAPLPSSSISPIDSDNEFIIILPIPTSSPDDSSTPG